MDQQHNFLNKEGQTIPESIFHTRQNHDWVDINSRDVFAGKIVIVFSLPGAYTPTCSSSHLPRFNQLAPLLKKHGVVEIICIAVNDAFVMQEWARDQKADHITFLPDGNGDFTDGMDLLVDKKDLGFGKRSRRYSMLVKDGVIEKQFIEPDVEGDPFLVSDADTMLKYIAPEAQPPLDVSVFTRPGCKYCARAKALLHNADIAFEELVLNRDYTDRTLRAMTGTGSVPQIFINGDYIGGAEPLAEWFNQR